MTIRTACFWEDFLLDLQNKVNNYLTLLGETQFLDIKYCQSMVLDGDGLNKVRYSAMIIYKDE